MTDTERKAWIKKARLHIAYLEKAKARLESENADLRAENEQLRHSISMTLYEQP